jgi:ribosomal-protein-alanine N-acetyltransferase
MIDPLQLAALHAESFTGPARWSEAAFAAAMDQPTCFLVSEGAAPDGFALGRVAAGEAELLTLVVSRGLRRHGMGRGLLLAFEEGARARGASEAFLEVAADNVPAVALYREKGWLVVGTRSGYYEGTDALQMRKGLI